MIRRHMLSASLISSLVCAVALAQEPALFGANASVEGMIVNKNLSAVIVYLEISPPNPLAYSDGYSAQVESDGSFHFHDIAPGTYRLTASAALSMFGEYGSQVPGQPGEILRLNSGGRLRGLSLELFPDPQAICGHVVDENGNPVQTDVEIYRAPDLQNGAPIRVELPTRHTDSHGFFTFPVSTNRDEFFVRADGVWYPSTDDFSRAVPVESSMRSVSRCNTNIRHERGNCTGRLHGEFQTPWQCDTSDYDALLYAIHPSGALFLADSHPLFQKDEAFFDKVCDGNYAMVVHQGGYCGSQGHWQHYASPTSQPIQGQTTTVQLNEATNLEFSQIGRVNRSQPQPASIVGTIHFEDLTWDQACPAHTWPQVTLRRHGSNAGGASPDPDGNFALNNVWPDYYQLVFDEAMHGAAYIKSFRLNGRTADPAHFAVSSGQSAHVDVVFSNKSEGAAGHERVDYTAAPHFIPEKMHPAASITGKLLGGPVQGTIVELRAIQVNSARSERYQSTVSENGSFHFGLVDPGIYKLFAEGGKIQYSAYGAKGPGLEGLPIVLAADEHLDSVSFMAYPKSPLCGRVINAEGKPQPGVDVGMEAAEHFGGLSDSFGTHVETDERGRFTFPEVGPGSFLLWAKYGSETTYFPSVRNRSYMSIIHLRPGDSTCSYDLHLRTAAKATFRRTYVVSGTIEGKLEPGFGHRFFAKLISVGPKTNLYVEPAEIDRSGRFKFDAVMPGRYTLKVLGECENTAAPCYNPLPDEVTARNPTVFFVDRLLASEQVTVTGADIADLRVKLGTPPTVTGEVLIDGKKPVGQELQLVPVLFDRPVRFDWPNQETGVRAKLDDNGRFSLAALQARDYSFGQDNSASAYYVRSIVLNGKSIAGTRLPLHLGDSAHLVIDMASDGASGTLTLGPHEVPNDPYVDQCSFLSGLPLFLMIPDPLPADNSGIIATYASGDGEGNSSGKAQIGAVPPGNYRLLGLELLDKRRDGNLFSPDDVLPVSHDALVRLAALGRPAEAERNEHFDWTVPLVTEQMIRLKAEMRLPAAH